MTPKTDDLIVENLDEMLEEDIRVAQEMCVKFTDVMYSSFSVEERQQIVDQSQREVEVRVRERYQKLRERLVNAVSVENLN